MRVTVVVPTYQEVDNVARFLNEVRRAVPDAHILIVDDNSPDGTGKLADELGVELGNIAVLHRLTKAGLGNAYRAGFAYVLDPASGSLHHQPDVIVTMDCDLSHDPASIVGLLAQIDRGADAVVGSRYVPGGGTVNWSLSRRLLSRWGNRYTASVLRLNVRDCTSGFRAYTAAALRAIDPASTTADGYAFLTELLKRLVRSGHTVTELPITFVDRELGTSKMSSRIVVESMALVTRWGVGDLGRAALREVSTRRRRP